jgi:hypothetical protein
MPPRQAFSNLPGINRFDSDGCADQTRQFESASPLGADANANSQSPSGRFTINTLRLNWCQTRFRLIRDLLREPNSRMRRICRRKIRNAFAFTDGLVHNETKTAFSLPIAIWPEYVLTNKMKKPRWTETVDRLSLWIQLEQSSSKE